MEMLSLSLSSSQGCSLLSLTTGEVYGGATSIGTPSTDCESMRTVHFVRALSRFCANYGKRERTLDLLSRALEVRTSPPACASTEATRQVEWLSNLLNE